MVDILLYNPHKDLIKDHLPQIKKAIDYYSKSYENILIDNFNAEISDFWFLIPDTACGLFLCYLSP